MKEPETLEEYKFLYNSVLLANELLVKRDAAFTQRIRDLELFQEASRRAIDLANIEISNLEATLDWALKHGIYMVPARNQWLYRLPDGQIVQDAPRETMWYVCENARHRALKAGA